MIFIDVLLRIRLPEKIRIRNTGKMKADYSSTTLNTAAARYRASPVIYKMLLLLVTTINNKTFCSEAQI